MTLACCTGFRPSPLTGMGVPANPAGGVRLAPSWRSVHSRMYCFGWELLVAQHRSRAKPPAPPSCPPLRFLQYSHHTIPCDPAQFALGFFHRLPVSSTSGRSGGSSSRWAHFLISSARCSRWLGWRFRSGFTCAASRRRWVVGYFSVRASWRFYFGPPGVCGTYGFTR